MIYVDIFTYQVYCNLTLVYFFLILRFTFLRLCYYYYYAPRKISGEHIVAALSVRPSVSQSVRPSVRPIRVRLITLLFEVGFRNFFYRNDHHVETTCREQHLGRYLEGQGHSATL